MRKIGFIATKLGKGGAERVISLIATELAKYCETYIFILGKEEDVEYNTTAKIKFINCERKNIVFKTIFYIKELKKSFDMYNIDDVISFMEYPNILNILMNHKKKKILSVRNHMSTKWGKGFKSFLWRSTIYLYRFSDLIITPSEDIRFDLIENFKINVDSIIRIYNPIDDKQISSISLKTAEIRNDDLNNFMDNRFTIITMGSLVPAKGHMQIIYAIEKLIHLNYNLKLIILGDGPLKAKFTEYILKNKLANHIYLLGFQKNPYFFLKHSNLYILSSYYEGLPNALLEAIACNLPVIAVDCHSGPREILLDDNNVELLNNFDKILLTDYGVLIPNYSKDEQQNMFKISENVFNIKESIIKFYKNIYPEKKYIMNKDKIREKFNLEKIGLEWLESIEKIG